MNKQPWSLGGPASVPFDEHPCPCRSEHAPSVPWTHRHHIVPLYAGGPDTPGNIAHVCPATHDWIHVILREFEKTGSVSARRQGWPFYAYKMAVAGFTTTP